MTRAAGLPPAPQPSAPAQVRPVAAFPRAVVLCLCKTIAGMATQPGKFVTMKSRFRLQLLLVSQLMLLPFFQGCAALRESPFSEPQGQARLIAATVDKLVKAGILKKPDQPDFKADGHFYTVYYVASLARVEQRLRLTCFAQAPDAILLYNAVPVSFWGVFTPKYRSHIVNSLHSLHGGDHAAVVHRRNTLQRLVSESYAGRKPDWQTGFLIHALGDSYAHVHGPFESSVAYGEAVGHGFSWFSDPDNIYQGENYKKYNAYALALFDALARGDSQEGRAQLTIFTQALADAVQHQQPHPGSLTPILSTQATGTADLSACKDMHGEITTSAAKAFLSELTAALKSPTAR